MIDAIILIAGLIIFGAGFLVGASWRRSNGRRARPALTLPDEWPR